MPPPTDRSGALRVASAMFRAAIGIGAILIAGAVFAFLVKTKPEPIRREIEERIVTVRTVPIEPTEVVRSWEGYGTARAMNAADVSAQVSARVIERPEGVRAGAAVARGDVLVRLDPEDFEQRVAASEGQIASWEAQLEALDVEERRLADRLELAQEQEAIEEGEVRRLVEAQGRGAGSTSELERRRAQLIAVRRETTVLRQEIESLPARRSQLRAMLAAERANLRMAQENLERTVIVAPIGGVLQEFDADVGELPAVGTPMGRIVDLSRIEVPLRLPAAARAEIDIGNEAEVREGRGGGGRVWRGRVVRIAPEIDPATRTFAAFVEVVQDPVSENGVVGGGLLYPGQFVTGRVLASAARARAIVPRRAIDGGAVMVVGPEGEGGLARARRAEVEPLFNLEGRYPELDEVETQWTAIGGGLEPGVRVIVSNLDEVRPGTLVRAASAGRAGGGASEAASAGPGGEAAARRGGG